MHRTHSTHALLRHSEKIPNPGPRVNLTREINPLWLIVRSLCLRGRSVGSDATLFTVETGEGWIVFGVGGHCFERDFVAIGFSCIILNRVIV